MSRQITKLRRRVTRLQRRADYLRDRVADWKGKPGGQHYDLAELAALEWALPILQAHVAELAHAEQVARADQDARALAAVTLTPAHYRPDVAYCWGCGLVHDLPVGSDAASPCPLETGTAAA